METTQPRGYNFALLVVIQIAVLILIFIGFFVGFSRGDLYWDSINGIAIGSLILFIILCIAGCLSIKLYFIFLVFQIIAFPAVVDNFIPGVYQGSLDEFGASIFPLFTHIDVYLVLGILIGVVKGNKAMLLMSKYLIFSIIVLFLSSVVNLFYSEDTQGLLLVIAGLIHLRYLILFFILFSLFKPEGYLKSITTGLIISVIFLFLESLMFTALNGEIRLTSGTLGNNSYGNVIACITVYFIFIFKTKSYPHRILLFLSIFIGVTIVILTGTRMAILSGVLTYFIGLYYQNRRSFLRIVYALLVFFGLGIFLLSTDWYKSNVPKRLDIEHLSSMVHFNAPGSGRSIIEIEQSQETNSLFTRFKLYNTSANMISDNPIFGIGSMRWNYYKNDFGFDERILLDTHNGYLAILSQFGLFAIVFIYLIYFLPITFFNKRYAIEGASRPYVYLALISMGMAISDLSNAGIYKHQIYGLLCLIIMILLANKSKV